MAKRRSPSPKTTNEFQRGVFEYAGARAAFEELAGLGVDPDLTFQWLGVMSQLEMKRRRSRPTRIAGLPMPKFRRLAKRVERWAVIIERANSGIRQGRLTRAIEGLFGRIRLPEFPEPVEPATREMFLERIHSLPFVLREYASYLKVIDQIFHGSKRIVDLRIEEVRMLFVDHVRTVTGTPHYRLIAHLLTAAYHAVGYPEEVDSHALEMAYRRFRQRRA